MNIFGFGDYDGLLSEKDLQGMQNNALTQMGLSIMANSTQQGYKPRLGQLLAQGYLQGQASGQGALQNKLQAMTLTDKMEERKQKKAVQEALSGFVPTGDPYQDAISRAQIFQQAGDEAKALQYLTLAEKYRPESADSGIGSLSPENYTPSSLQVFKQSGNFSDLVPVAKPNTQNKYGFTNVAGALYRTNPMTGEAELVGGRTGFGDAPSGYMWNPEGTALTAIPGGPQDPTAGEAGAKAQARRENQVFTANNAIDTISTAMGLLDKWNTTGVIGKVAGYLPGSDRIGLEGTYDTLKANMSFSKLMEIKSSSPTGGGLGSTSDNELRLLAADIASLDPDAPVDIQRKNLAKIEARFKKIRDDNMTAEQKVQANGGSIRNQQPMTMGGWGIRLKQGAE